MKELIVYKIMNAQNGKMASRHRGIDFVKGKGSSWSDRKWLINSIVDSLVGYCGSGNDICPKDLTIITMGSEGTRQQSLKDFCSPEELNFIKESYLEQIADDSFYDTNICLMIRQKKDHQLEENEAREEFVTDFIAENEDGWYELAWHPEM